MSVAAIPGVRLDVERSTLELAGRSFPAAVILDPVDGDWWGGVVELADPGCQRAWSVFVPMENGAMLAATLSEGELSLYLHAPFWHPHVPSGRAARTNEDDLEVAFCSVQRGRIVPGGLSGWSACEPGWAVEHIERLSRMPVDQIAGRPVELRPVGDALEREGPGLRRSGPSL